jgi:protein-disulfide isomerase
VLLLAFWGMRQPSSELAGRVAGYIFVLATAGLAVVFYYGYASFFKLGAACPICMTMYAAVAGIFLVSAAAATSLTAIPARLGEDLTGLTKSQSGTTLAVAWVAASIALLVLFPHPDQFGSTAPSAVEAATEPPLETLTPEQIIEWDKYLDSRVPVTEVGVLPSGTAKVLLIKFNDYQCPSCRQTWAMYRGIIEKYEKEYPGVFVYATRDLPLEPECGLQLNHTMACEAAAAVRMAREKNKGREMEAWLFNNQSFEMTRDDVKRGLREVAQITDFDAQYPKMLPAIRADVQLAQKLGATGTPTFFINGVRLDINPRPAWLDATIQYFLKKSGAAS